MACFVLFFFFIFFSLMERRNRDQLYFDRVHKFAPMLHRRRYLSWANAPSKSHARLCLQHAMWTMAAALSSPFQHIGDSLYQDTKQLMETREPDEKMTETLQIEAVQASIMLCLYEFRRDQTQRSLMRMGHVFRMVQLMRLHTVDSPSSIMEDVIEMEERRRTFWMAYVIDGFVSLNTGLPLTLNEQEVSIEIDSKVHNQLTL
jgi:Fungal specific transcription factor domain